MNKYSTVRKNLPRSGIRKIMESSALIPNVIHLEVGEPNVDTPSHIIEEAYKSMNDGFTHYTPNTGLNSLKEDISSHLKIKYNLAIDQSNIAVTVGAVSAIHVSLLTLVDSGEKVLIPDPGWPNYEQMILNQEAVPLRYKLDPNTGFLPDFDQLEKVVTEDTKVIIINTPGNPTGGVFDEKVILKLINFAKKHSLYIISDEVYDGIVFDGTHVCVKSYDDDDRIISIFSFSKNYAMTGWRVGYAVAPKEMVPIMAKTIESMVSCPSSVSQKAAEAALKGPQEFVQNMKEVYLDRRNKACEIFEQNNIKAYKPKGAFYVMVDLSETNLKGSELALRLLEEEKVAVAPGTTFGESTESMIRISLATGTSQLIEGVNGICHFVNQLRKNNKTTFNPQTMI